MADPGGRLPHPQARGLAGTPRCLRCAVRGTHTGASELGTAQDPASCRNGVTPALPGPPLRRAAGTEQLGDSWKGLLSGNQGDSVPRGSGRSLSDSRSLGAEGRAPRAPLPCPAGPPRPFPELTLPFPAASRFGFQAFVSECPFPARSDHWSSRSLPNSSPSRKCPSASACIPRPHTPSLLLPAS